METNSTQYKLVIGLGVTGMSTVRFLASRNDNFKVVDSRPNPPCLAELQNEFPEVELELGSFRQELFEGAAELLVSPGVPLATPAIRAAQSRGVPVSGDIDLFSKHADAPIVAVTGSNGKSTVVELLAAILRRADINFGLGGNLDGANFRPALDLLGDDSLELYVLEISSFQLETTARLGAKVATILNLSADHLDRYGSMADYTAAKQRIYHGASQLVTNRDDALTWPQTPTAASIRSFGFSAPDTAEPGLENGRKEKLENGKQNCLEPTSKDGTSLNEESKVGLVEESGTQYLTIGNEKIIATGLLKIFGQHNVANAMAAAALADALGIGMEPIRAGIRGFTGLPHRCQWVAEVAGVNFYNDSKGTNVGATAAAVAGLGERISGNILLIAGGVGKGADFKSLVPAIQRWVKVVILLGQDAVRMAAEFGRDIHAHIARDMQDAVDLARQHAAPGDAVLLSPACASFDMFESYQHRGQSFIQSVENLR